MQTNAGKAWNEGKEAFDQGLSDDDNPYEASDESHDWDAGWCDGQFKVDCIKQRYEQYLKSTNTCGVLVCNECGWIYSHPLNYCVKCPGKIVRANLVVIDEIRAYLKQDHFLSEYISEFSEFYKQQTGTEFPHKDFQFPGQGYWTLLGILRKMLD